MSSDPPRQTESLLYGLQVCRRTPANVNEDNMESEEAMLSVKEQVETEYEQIVSGNLNTLRRLSKTGQPVDQGDRDIIRFLVLVALGHFYEGSA